MAGTTSDFPSGAPFYLDPTQQDLLLAALASNTHHPLDHHATGARNSKSSTNNAQFPYPIDTLDPTFFNSPHQANVSNAYAAGIDESPFVDYLDGDTSFDFDNADGGELMIGDMPEDTPGSYEESNEKRKNPDDDDDEDDEGGGKRREGDDKKKPGRKPLTSEPTTKRKAQNRAAQRAFRERKEKHLKDLETKVEELEKTSDASNQENGILRAQVQRLQMELREYRKRLSLNSTALNRPQAPATGFSAMLNNNTNSNFQFEFPRFGGLANTNLLDNGSVAKAKAAPSSAGPNAQRDSFAHSVSPTHQTSGFGASFPTQTSTSPTTNSPSSRTTASDRRSTNSSNVTQSRVFQFNSGSSTHSGSPSASSTSPAGLDSSCGTSPEPSHTSPGQSRDLIAEGYVCTGNSEVTKAMSPVPAVNGIDYFANQNGGQFDPTLFGDYREPQNAIIGDGDFTGGFFNDAFLNTNFGSPFHFGDTPAVEKSDPLEKNEQIHDGEEEVVPGEDVGSMLNCHKIWDRLSNRHDFKDGTIDIDSLCSELRAKARCSESGVVVDHKDVEEALKRLPKEKQSGYLAQFTA